MKIKRPDEAIRLMEKRLGYFPHVFQWRGRLYRVVSTEDCRTVLKRGPFSRMERLYFRVRCAEGMFELFQDVLNNTWHVEKVRPARVRAKAA